MDFMTFYRYLKSSGASHDRALLAELQAEISAMKNILVSRNLVPNHGEMEKHVSIARKRALVYFEQAKEAGNKPKLSSDFFGFDVLGDQK